MLNPPEGVTAAKLSADIDRAREHLRALLLASPRAALSERPPGGKWSVMENLRHLLFAEQLHFGRVMGGPGWTQRPGVPEEYTRRSQTERMLGPGDATVEAVWEAWDMMHEPVRALGASDTAEVREALYRNLRHLRTHVKVIERLLRR